MPRPGTGASRGYKRVRSVLVGLSSRRRVAKYLKRGQQNPRDRNGGSGRSREGHPRRNDGVKTAVSKGGEVDKFPK